MVRRMGTVGVMSQQASVNIAGQVMNDLIPTNAVYDLSQGGGPLVSANGRLLGINLLVQSPQGGLMGFAIPVHVLFKDFQDVMEFPVPLPEPREGRAQTAPGVPAYMPGNGAAQAVPVKPYCRPRKRFWGVTDVLPTTGGSAPNPSCT